MQLRQTGKKSYKNWYYKDRVGFILCPFLFSFFEFALKINLIHFCKTKGLAFGHV